MLQPICVQWNVMVLLLPGYWLINKYWWGNSVLTYLTPLETPTTEDYVEVGHDAKVTCKVTNSQHDGNIVFEMNSRMISAVPVSDGGRVYIFILRCLQRFGYFPHKTWLPHLWLCFTIYYWGLFSQQLSFYRFVVQSALQAKVRQPCNFQIGPQ